MNDIKDGEIFLDTLKNIYDQMGIGPEDVGQSPDEILHYVKLYDLDEDTLYSYIQDLVKEGNDKPLKEEVITESFSSFMSKLNN